MAFVRWLSTAILSLLTCGLHIRGRAAEEIPSTRAASVDVAPASEEGQQAIRRFRVPKDWKVELIAAEPDLANPVAFAFDEQERIFVVETFRLGTGVLDIRGRAGWPSAGFKKNLSADRRAALPDEVLDADLACRTVADRERMLRNYFAENAPSLESYPDRLRLIYRGPDGRAQRSTVFADGFRNLVDGLAAGVLARGSDVWYTDIPHLWRFRDTDGDGVADERVSLLEGFGVRVGFLGHDLHGLCFGPDGRLYFSIGDRGAEVISREGKHVSTPETGAIFRCDPDGANLELFATGLRNPQELVFDDLGNLWTGDNNSDGGDQARWTYLVEGGDSGWRIGYQFQEAPFRRGPWNAEHMWRPAEAVDIGFIVPPLANIGAGPSGVTYGFGTGLPEELNGRFFMVDFRGGPSGIWSISVQPRGAGYEVVNSEQLIWNALPTDVDVGPDGGLYWSDWVQGWGKTGKGRIYRTFNPDVVNQPIVAETRRLLAADLNSFDHPRLAEMLNHPDLRVRRRAQFVLADQMATETLRSVAIRGTNRYARLHALWGLGQSARKQSSILGTVVELLDDADPEVRGQAAKLLGDFRYSAAGPALERVLGDSEARPRFFAAIALGRLGHRPAGPALIEMLRTAQDQDPFLRHAGVMGLVGTRSAEELRALAKDPYAAVRKAAVVALRRLQSPFLGDFLADPDPGVLLEAARAINDLPVPEALPRLALLIQRDALPQPLLRRVLNANLRVGDAASANALARFAANSGAPESARAEALRDLGQFPAPAGRDTVTGLWRPLTKRDPASAKVALRDHFTSLIRGPEAVQTEAANAAGQLGQREVAPELRRLAHDGNAEARARVATLRALQSLDDDQLPALVGELATDAQESVRTEAMRMQGRYARAEALKSIQTALERGGVNEQQAAMASLSNLQGEAADNLLATWLNRGAKGTVPLGLQLDLLDAGRAHDTGAVKIALAKFEASLASTNDLVARRYVLQGGDAEAGRKVFFEKEEVQCVRCHKVGGDGGIVGPDLKGLGSRQSREYIFESIVRPNAAIAPGFDNLTVETRDGGEVSGTVQNETSTELSLNTIDNGVVTLKKTDITDRRRGLSSMPDGFADILSAHELRDLVEYLADLREGGPSGERPSPPVR